MALVALTRQPADSLVKCELTHLARTPIDVAVARAQHQAYVAELRAAGVGVTVLDALEDYPDSVFVEDAAVVLPEFVLVTRPGASSREAEPALLAAQLPADRPHAHLPAGARLDGGDVLMIGRRIFIGLSTRTTASAVEAVRAQAGPYGYQVHGVPVPGALHLKTAVTTLDAETIVLNPAWVAPEVFSGCRWLVTPAGEPFSANVLALDEVRLVPAEHPHMAEQLDQRGYGVRVTPIAEFAKAEAGVTCLSVIWS